MQKNKHIFRGMFLAVAGCVALAGCGGGGDLENGVTALTVSPQTATFNGPDKNTCYKGNGGRYFIYGGTSPYTVQNTLPAFMTVSTTTVPNVGGSFDVTFLGGCINGGVINVTDSVGRLVAVTLTATVSAQ